jgi:predicted membrane GTPase involved in stress response
LGLKKTRLDDEYVEITPDAIRMRKKVLDANERYRLNRK